MSTVISLDNVSYQYEQTSELAISEVSVSIQKNEMDICPWPKWIW